MSLAKAKIWTLEKEKAGLQGKLDAQAEISSAVQEIIPKLDDIKNSKDQNLIAEIPRIIKEVTSPDIRSSVEVACREIMAEVKKTRDETRTFAHVAFQSRNLPPSQVPPSLRSSPLGEPEGILLIKPKKETLKDFIINKKIFTDILEKYDPSIRLRGIGKLYGGGVRMVAASHGDIMIVKGLIEEYGDKETMDGFDFVIPNRRSPQLIIYNVDGEVDQEQLKAGILAKNITLAVSANKPYFKVEFSIPARNSLKKHWVLSIDPKKFIEIKNRKGLYFQFSPLRTSEFISIRFCKRCFAYGHTTKNCDPKNEQKCDRCGPTMAYNSLRGIQINVNHCVAAHSGALLVARDLGLDFIAIQDPYLMKGEPLKANFGCKVFMSEGKRAITYVLNKSLNCYFKFNTMNSVTVELHFNNIIFNVFNCYFPPHDDMEQTISELQDYNFCNSFNLVVGDFNCKSRSWGYDSDNFRGRKLSEFIAASNLHICNISEYGPTFQSTIHVGFPDLTLLSIPIINYMKNWGVLYMESHSDHKYIYFNLELEDIPEADFFLKSKYGINKFSRYVKKNAGYFKNKLAKSSNIIYLNNLFLELTDFIKKAAFKTLKNKPKKFAKKYSFWNEDLRLARNKVSMLFKIYNRHKLSTSSDDVVQSSGLAYRKARAEYKRLLLSTKRKAWEIFCTNYNERFNFLFQLAFNKGGSQDSIRVNPNDNPSNTIRDKITYIMDNFFPGRTSEDDFNYIPVIGSIDLILIEDLELVFKGLERGKAPGLDRIDYHMWGAVFNLDKIFMLELFNTCFKLNYFPRCLRNARIFFLLKDGKDPGLCNSYRPVCLLPTLGVWGGDLNKYHVDRLHTIQRIFLLKFARGYRTTSTNVLNVLTGIPPLHITAKAEFLKFQIWVRRSGDYNDIINNVQLDHNILIKNIPSDMKLVSLSEHLSDATYEVYTDGSKINEETGLAVCILNDNDNIQNFLFKLKPYNSVFQAELAAIQFAANWAVSENSKINLYTDSLSSILALQSASSRENFEKKVETDLFKAKNLVGLSWVKAHVGIQGNELADQQAKLATTTGEELSIPAPRSYLNRTLKQLILHEWCGYCNKYTSASGIRVRGF
ncbi:hypothetical protein AVEN_137319-1 [Araneus ventricosus]|uniref:RNase H type-1 domain-containing protein n=1 Tax=Araneus ventricosus TaxID=182803 RepID=A0A4Y2FIB0_ARAVE|nr:hypothetical protein AVEN_137319-1 [Araneus ventricosus]